MRDLVAPGLLILAARTGWTRTEALQLTLRRLVQSLQPFTKR